MAKLIRCSDCRKKISARAESCPNCGAPVEAPEKGPRQYSLAGLLNGLLLIACVIVGIGAFQDHPVFSIYSFIVAAALIKPVRMMIASRTQSPKLVSVFIYVVFVGLWVYGASTMGTRSSYPPRQQAVTAAPATATEQPANMTRAASPSATAPARAPRDMWVTSDRLERYTCPSTQCGAVGALFFRAKAVVLEERDGWARVSKYYDGSCRGGISDYVDSGNNRCKPANGFDGEEFAEWVQMANLAETRPADPAAGASGAYELVAGSDDYRVHKEIFAKSATQLISSGRCSAEDFRNNGGWVKSMTHKDKPIYFTYCDGYNKVYLDAGSGQVTN